MEKYTAYSLEEVPTSVPNTGATAAIEVPAAVVDLLGQALGKWQSDVENKLPIVEDIIGVGEWLEHAACIQGVSQCVLPWISGRLLIEFSIDRCKHTQKYKYHHVVVAVNANSTILSTMWVVGNPKTDTWT
jgi:hypothetical protein